MNIVKKAGLAGLFLMIVLVMGSSCVMAKDIAICIDPGHQGNWIDMSAPEPVAPGASATKAKATTGTQGSFSGVPEYQLNLDISLLLEQELKDRGYRVVLTRSDNDTAISNSERALLASEMECDVMVRIHANSSTDPQVSGALAMVMTQDNPYVGDLFEESYRLALSVLNSYCQETGFTNMGIQSTDDMTGINWSKVPVMILEMGYMSNQMDDTLMQDAEMRQKMVKGIADGLDGYFRKGEADPEKGEEAPAAVTESAEAETEGLTDSEMHPEPAPSAQPLKGIASMLKKDKKEDKEEEETPEKTNDDILTDPMMSQLYDQFILPREQQGQMWAVSIEVLGDPDAGETEKAEETTEAGETEAVKETEKPEEKETGETEKAEKTEEKETGKTEETGETEEKETGKTEETEEAEEKETGKTEETEKDGESKTILEYNSDVVMQSASVVKVFIMGAIYDRVCYPKDELHTVHWQESYSGELDSLLEAMITVSDNSAANRLIEILGEENFQKGTETLREFCMENGYVSTSIGRRFLEENPTGDNYTSAADCRKILSDIYYGRCVNKEASEKMLGRLKRQTVRHKIPSGLPAGYSSANKTGEMPEGYGLGCIENDMAIVFGPEKAYVLVVLSNNLGGDNSGAQQNISAISSFVASNIR